LGLLGILVVFGLSHDLHLLRYQTVRVLVVQRIVLCLAYATLQKPFKVWIFYFYFLSGELMLYNLGDSVNRQQLLMLTIQFCPLLIN
jgi:hypothetical protein